MSPPSQAPASTSLEPALIIGCGYLGRRVAALWQAAGRNVAALTRRNAEAFAAQGLLPVPGDVLEPQSLRALPRVRTVLYAVGFDRGAGKTMRDVYVQGLSNILDALPAPDRFLYISSTSVYGQTGGEWVDEQSAMEPREEAGKVIREAEELLRSRRPDAIVLRSAGIYGPDRLLRKAAILKGEPLAANADGFLNLIHVADGAAAVVTAESQGLAGETYLLADDTPVTRRDFYTCLAGLLHAPEAKFDSAANAPAQPDANRRISNRKLRGLGWVPKFPSFREGLADAVAEST